MLDCHVRTIFHMIQKGELRPVKQGRYVGVWEEEVIALRDSRLKMEGERTLPFAINRQTLLRLDTEVRLLRQELNQVLRILNIRREALKATDLEIVSLYQTANDYANEGWPPQVEEVWVGYLNRLDIEHFRQIEKVTKDRHPWRPFMRLACTMPLRPYNTELTLQLAGAREHVQMLVSVWFEVNQISPRQLDAMLAREASPSKRLLGVLERRQAKYAAKD